MKEENHKIICTIVYSRPLEKHVFAIKYAYAMTGWIKQGKRQER